MRVLSLALLSLLPAAVFANDAVNDERFWAQWRGPRMAGISPNGYPPLEWSESKNVAWKKSLPGHGSSTPVIWEDRLYVLTAVPAEGEAVKPDEVGSAHAGMMAAGEVEQIFKVLALRRSDGSVVWERTANRALPHEGKQQNNSYASGSAVTDGVHLIARRSSRRSNAGHHDGRAPRHRLRPHDGRCHLGRRRPHVERHPLSRRA
jgi:hypothetical protein